MAEYIEREAMVKASCERCNGEYVPCDKEHCLLMEVIHSIPAADVRPVVKAKWVYTDMSRLVCSNCGNPVAFALKDNGWHHGDFCPNCGAMMEES